MLSVFICGVLGFFCYEILRLGKVYYDNKVVELFFGGMAGLMLRVLLHIVAGIVGVFASADVIMKLQNYAGFSPEPELIGSYLRAFAIGFGGPASISKWDSSAGIIRGTTRSAGKGTKTLDTLENHTVRTRSNTLAKLKFSAHRIFLR